MSTQRFGFYFSANADKSANDYTVYVDMIDASTVNLGARYKNADRNNLYETIMDAQDLHRFGQMCCDLARQMQS